jgi:integrase
MQGFMRQRGRSWELRVYLGRDAVTAKKRWATKTVRGGKREAQSALAAMVAEADRGGLVTTSATVGDLLERWFEHAAADFSPKTVLETRGFLDRNLLPAFGAVRLSKLRTDDLDRFYRQLRINGARSGQPLAPATIRRIHGILRRALSQGVRWGWLGSNPASEASPPRVDASEISPPAPNDVARLFALAEKVDPDLAAFVILAAATGARRSEVIALRWADVDLDVGAVKVGRAIVMGPDGLIEKDTKTHASRQVSLDPTTLALLREHRERVVTRAEACRLKLPKTAFLFSHEVDGSLPWRPDSTTRAFASMCRRAGLPSCRLHDLRHYVATRLLSSGVDARTVAGRLGHRNAATTLNVYAQFLPEADREAANVLGRLFDTAVANGSKAMEPGSAAR